LRWRPRPEGVTENCFAALKTIKIIQSRYNRHMLEKRISFGPFVLDAAAGTLLRQGITVPVGYRAFVLLRTLVEASGEIVSKATLMDAAWPGMAIEESNLSVQIGTLRRLLGETPEGSEWIANVPRLGYRFTAAIERSRDTPIATQELGPSIVVLPFASLSDDSEQAYFADGLTEDLITRLARLHWLYVASRNSSFSYKGKPFESGQVGRDLRVRYALEGSVRRSANRLRISSKLSDASTGRQVWAGNYDVELADFFALQDQISEAVVAAIEPRLYTAEHERFKSQPPDSLDAWGFVMKAMPHVWTWGAPEEIARAQELLGKAIAIDHDYPRANSLLAWTYAAQAQLGLADFDAVLPGAIATAQRAIQQAPEDPLTHFAAGYAHMVGRNTTASVAALSEAIDINPSFALAHMILGSTYGYAARPEEGLHHLALAERMSPRDFSQSAIYATQATCHFVAGRYAQAADLGRRAVELRPHFGTAWRTLAASSGMAGDVAGGQRALAQARRLHPELTLEWARKYHPIVQSDALGRYVDGLLIAGLD
jgi:TolB-like protein/Tfp pilus assembly protein PilF